MVDHTSFVFGLTDKKPNLSDYALPSKQVDVPAELKQAGVPSGFQLVGTWRQKGSSAKLFEFKTNHIAISPSGAELKWEARDGNYILFWKSGNPAKIEILDAKSVRIGKQVYEKAD